MQKPTKGEKKGKPVKEKQTKENPERDGMGGMMEDISMGYGNMKKGYVMKTIRKEGYPECVVSNVVSYMLLNMKQNQKCMALRAKKKLPVFYDSIIFASSQLQVKVTGYPPVKVLFFSRKSQTIVGGVSEDHNRLVAWSVVMYLRNQFHIDIEMESLTTKNIVAHIYMPFRVNLEAVYADIPGRCEFKPECIDCCRIKSIYGDPIRFLIFGTGSILVVGCRYMSILEKVHVEACDVATKHRSFESTSKSVSQKYKQKKRLLNQDVVRNTNISIENTMSAKRRKIAVSNQSSAVKKVNLEMFDELCDFNGSAAMAYRKLLEEESKGKGQKSIEAPFTPHKSPYLEYDTKSAPLKLEFNVEDIK